MLVYVLEILTFELGEYETKYPFTATKFFTTLEAAEHMAEETYTKYHLGEFFEYKIKKFKPLEGEELHLETIKKVTYK